MKQTEKLDAILRNAYACYLEHKSMDYFDVKELLAKARVKVSFEEKFALGKRLERQGIRMCHPIFGLGQYFESFDYFYSLYSSGLDYDNRNRR
jgi:hypothetical protein